MNIIRVLTFKTFVAPRDERSSQSATDTLLVLGGVKNIILCLGEIPRDLRVGCHRIPSVYHGRNTTGSHGIPLWHRMRSHGGIPPRDPMAGSHGGVARRDPTAGSHGGIERRDPTAGSHGGIPRDRAASLRECQEDPVFEFISLESPPPLPPPACTRWGSDEVWSWHSFATLQVACVKSP